MSTIRVGTDPQLLPHQTVPHICKDDSGKVILVFLQSCGCCSHLELGCRGTFNVLKALLKLMQEFMRYFGSP